MVNSLRVGFIVGCVAVAACWSGSAQASSKPLDPCTLLTTAQASAILGGTVQHPIHIRPSHGADTTACVYLTLPPTQGGGSGPSLMLDVNHSARARKAAEELLRTAEHPRARVKVLNGLPPGVTEMDIKPRLITVDHIRGVYTSIPKSGADPVSGSLIVLRDGYAIRVGVQSTPNPVATAAAVVRVVAPQLQPSTGGRTARSVANSTPSGATGNPGARARKLLTASGAILIPTGQRWSERG